MQRFRVSLALCAVAGLAFSGAADAHWHGGVGVYVGGPVYPYPYYPPDPYYYPPAPVVVAPAPSDTYVEQGQPGPDAQQEGSPEGTWYYCDAAKAYYPYVQQCAGGWREVPAVPPAPGQ